MTHRLFSAASDSSAWVADDGSRETLSDDLKWAEVSLSYNHPPIEFEQPGTGSPDFLAVLPVF
jgi:hypothetical protein